MTILENYPTAKYFVYLRLKASRLTRCVTSQVCSVNFNYESTTRDRLAGRHESFRDMLKYPARLRSKWISQSGVLQGSITQPR